MVDNHDHDRPYMILILPYNHDHDRPYTILILPYNHDYDRPGLSWSLLYGSIRFV
jgi:hypothetical protein